MTLHFKIAETIDEFDQIARIIHQTFAVEIPQYPRSEDGKLVDKFHEKNTYIIGKDGSRIVAMLAINDLRPFSLDEKVPELDSYLPPHKHAVEVRLLSVAPEFRGHHILYRLLQSAIESIPDPEYYDLILISGTTRQLKLYNHLGFTPFYQMVGKENAMYQPMYLFVSDLYKHLPRHVMH
jgi:GNAT superfamily N-acetyltransferase